jgi:catechol 2,3-dioxygenase-like lactoylglutathione lyase family enzyme
MSGSADDERPPVWVGHVSLRVGDVSESTGFFEALGMRRIFESGDVGVLELRGGTHLVLLPSDDPIPADATAPFDLMVDDIDATRERYAGLGLELSPLERGRIHDSFTLLDPNGYRVTVNSSHASGKPV